MDDALSSTAWPRLMQDIFRSSKVALSCLGLSHAQDLQLALSVSFFNNTPITNYATATLTDVRVRWGLAPPVPNLNEYWLIDFIPLC